MDDYTLSMADAINEYQDRFSADTEGVTEHQATIPADTNHSPGAKIVFASADAIATPSHRAADANICPTLSHVPQVGQVGQMGQVGQNGTGGKSKDLRQRQRGSTACIRASMVADTRSGVVCITIDSSAPGAPIATEVSGSHCIRLFRGSRAEKWNSLTLVA